MDQIRPISIHNRITTVVILSRFSYSITLQRQATEDVLAPNQQAKICWTLGENCKQNAGRQGGNAYQRCKCKQKDNKKSHRKMFQNAHWVTDNPERQYAKRLTINQC